MSADAVAFLITSVGCVILIVACYRGQQRRDH